MHLMHRNAKSVPWASEETLAPIGEQDSIDHDAGPRTSKSYSPSKEPGSMILRGYCGAKGAKDSSPFHIKPKAYAEEEELPEDEWRESKLLGYTAEDDAILDRPKSQEDKAPDCQRQSPWGSQRGFGAQWVSHRSMVEKQPQEKLSLPY